MEENPEGFGCSNCGKALTERQLHTKALTVESCPYCHEIVRKTEGFRSGKSEAVVVGEIAEIDSWLSSFAETRHVNVSSRQESGNRRVWTVATVYSPKCEIEHNPDKQGFVSVRLVRDDLGDVIANDFNQLTVICAKHGVEPHAVRQTNGLNGKVMIHWGAEQVLSTNTLSEELLDRVLYRLNKVVECSLALLKRMDFANFMPNTPDQLRHDRWRTFLAVEQHAKSFVGGWKWVEINRVEATGKSLWHSDGRIEVSALNGDDLFHEIFHSALHSSPFKRMAQKKGLESYCECLCDAFRYFMERQFTEVGGTWVQRITAWSDSHLDDLIRRSGDFRWDLEIGLPTYGLIQATGDSLEEFRRIFNTLNEKAEHTLEA